MSKCFKTTEFDDGSWTVAARCTAADATVEFNMSHSSNDVELVYMGGYEGTNIAFFDASVFTEIARLIAKRAATVGRIENT